MTIQQALINEGILLLIMVALVGILYWMLNRETTAETKYGLSCVLLPILLLGILGGLLGLVGNMVWIGYLALA